QPDPPGPPLVPDRVTPRRPISDPPAELATCPASHGDGLRTFSRVAQRAASTSFRSDIVDAEEAGSAKDRGMGTEDRRTVGRPAVHGGLHPRHRRTTEPGPAAHCPHAGRAGTHLGTRDVRAA